jgi:hypothetical protein
MKYIAGIEKKVVFYIDSRSRDNPGGGVWFNEWEVLTGEERGKLTNAIDGDERQFCCYQQTENFKHF